MDEERLKTLRWLAEQRFEEKRSLRATEDNLFNWSSTIFLAGFGALTGIKGMASPANTVGWGFTWRLLLILGVIAIVGVILFMAFLIRRNYDRNEESLASILVQLGEGTMNLPPQTEPLADSQLFFYARWSGLVALALVSLGLIWLLG